MLLIAIVASCLNLSGLQEQKAVSATSVKRFAGIKESDGLIPVHDLVVTNLGDDGRIDGYFYVGGNIATVGDLLYEPDFYINERNSDFQPGNKWSEISADLTSATYVATEGTLITFTSNVGDMEQFSIAVQMRGSSYEGIDEISFAATSYPKYNLDAYSKEKQDRLSLPADSVVPITFIRPYHWFPIDTKDHEIHLVYTNLPDYEILSDHLFYLSAKVEDPTIEMGWKNLKKFDGNARVYPPNTGERRHKLQFRKGPKHYMVVDQHRTTAPGPDGEDEEHIEWSGIMR
jgi:hypothetical protein